jgi:rhodanese-related sulfurtransferase
MLLGAYMLAPVRAQAEELSAQNYQNITVDKAYSMSRNGSFPNLVFLDVRYQCEYDMGHLDSAILIPYNELEMRIGELEQRKNSEIIVYCKAGSRSQIACETLAKYNFTKIYNMVGGIFAWIEAGYPIWTTSHYVTVNITDEEILLQIEPLLLHQTYVPCAQNQTCTNCNGPPNTTSALEEQRENFTKILMTYEVGGASGDVTVAKTLLRNYTEYSDESNRTLSFVYVEVVAGNISMQSYILNYLVDDIGYSLSLSTTLSPIISGAYYDSSTVMNYAPINGTRVTSLELVQVNSSVTLSETYAIFSKVARKMENMYKHDEDYNISSLAGSYHGIEKEAAYLSRLVRGQIAQYDCPVLHNSAILRDMMCGPCGCQNDECGGGGGSTCTFECFLYHFISCYTGDIGLLSMGCLWGCALGALICGPLYPVCVWPCIAACGIFDVAAVVYCVVVALDACCI